MATHARQTALGIEGLHPTAPFPLPFAPQTAVRAFLLERAQGNFLIYSTGRLEEDAPRLQELGGVARQYLNHWHEAMSGLVPPALGADLVLHEADSPSVGTYEGSRHAFAERHRVDSDFEVIPIPGHTPGATAYLWTTGLHRVLFTGDTIYLHKGKWRVAVLKDSDRQRYEESLELIRELDFDVLIPWAASADDPFLVAVDERERHAHIDTLLAWVRSGSRLTG